MGRSKIQQVEDYVLQTMAGMAGSDHLIGHDFKHVDRVRRWALVLAVEEGFADLELVEAAALLHDVGLARVEERGQHARAGAEVAARFLQEANLFSESERAAVVGAVRDHNALGDLCPLATIVRDADILDMLGAVGMMRAFTSKYALPEYDPRNVKGETWGITARDVDRRFAAGKGIGATIVDQINFQASCHGNLRTEAARRIGAPLVAFMRGFLMQLESEILCFPRS
jgi:putative nucleotidyltransferase with HDIG domain